ncbi:hypothetical protein AVEN_176071-1 [Araneus ventricosus]|uniref:Uncharacterized protein n=1 Tax=Araneus ventricosus TaxID=182803 RepID=A0A4Y2F6Z8_ARAVE|nr:hypothetical protein AVEN_176071-1 [Araneus ventricosus]
MHDKIHTLSKLTLTGAQLSATFSTENYHMVWMMFHDPPGRHISWIWKDKVYVPPMPTTLQALQESITAAVTDIDGNMLLNVWTELDYRWNVCRVTKSAHIELL